MSSPGDPDVVARLLVCAYGKTGSVLPAIDVVRLDGVEPLPLAHTDAGAHDRFEGTEGTNIQPALAGPAIGPPQDPAGKRVPIRPPVLPGPHVDVADDTPARGMKPRDDVPAGVEAVD